MDSTAIFKLSYGMFVIGVSEGGKDSGCVVNTVMQVTSSPVKVSTVISKTNYTHDLVKASGRYTVSVLTKDVPPLTIGTFGFMSGRDKNKFESIAYKRDAYGVPYLTEGVNAYLSCKVLETHDLGTHTMFISEVTDAENLNQDESMTYAYYRTFRKGTSPKAAPTHVEKSEDVKSKIYYKCSVCGYIYEGDKLPEDFVCPVCKQPASVFVRYEGNSESK